MCFENTNNALSDIILKTLQNSYKSSTLLISSYSQVSRMKFNNCFTTLSILDHADMISLRILPEMLGI